MGVSCAIIFLMMLTVNTDVLMRYVFNQPIIWAQEFCEYGLVYLTFLGTAYLLRNGKHIRMGLVYDQLKTRARALVESIFSLIGAVVAGLLVWYGIITVMDYAHRGIASYSILQIPQSPILAIIPIGCFLFLLQSLITAYENFARWRSTSLENTRALVHEGEKA
jgi:TRAP-type C4-dicarboxylate transport system permease small subunit